MPKLTPSLPCWAFKRQAVDQLVDIGKKDSVNFWKTYAAFEAEQSKLRKKRLQTYDKLVQSYNNLDDAASDQLAKDFIELRVGQEKLLEGYYGKMKAATSAHSHCNFTRQRHTC